MANAPEQTLLDAVDAVDGAVDAAADLNAAIASVLGVMLDVLGGDHAWLLYPCEPDAPSWQVTAETRRPSVTPTQPSAERAIANTPAAARMLVAALAADGPISIAPDGFGSFPVARSTSAVTPALAVTLRPKQDRPYLLVWHRDARGGAMTPDKQRLFSHMVHRITDLLTGTAAHRRLRDDIIEMGERFRMLSESTLTGIYIIENNKFRYVNDAMAHAFGYTADELIETRGPFDLIHPDDSDRVAYEMRGVLSGEVRETRHDNRAVRKDGSAFHVEVQCRRFEREGRSGIIGTMLDITDRKRLEQQLSDAQKMEAVGRLAGGIAHDFNNLLTVVQGSAELARNVVGPDHAANRLLDEIRHAADRAATLTRQLLALSRRQLLREQVIDVNNTLEQVAALLRRLIGEHVELTLSLTPSLGAAKVDPDQLAHVIINLAANARDAMPRGGRLTITTESADVDPSFAAMSDDLRPGPYVVVTVTDTGHGMDEATAARVFEPFFTTKPAGRGTGLGLATAYGFVKQSRGHIEVDSEIGRGTTFRLYLPRSEQPTAPRAEPTEIIPDARGAETVLLVEDEDAVRQMCKRVLESSGYTVLDARNGWDALEIGTRYPGGLDIIVSDVVMPRMGGAQLAGELLALHPKARVLFLSGYTDDEAISRALNAQIGFLQKPFLPAELASKVRELLDTRAAARA